MKKDVKMSEYKCFRRLFVFDPAIAILDALFVQILEHSFIEVLAVKKSCLRFRKQL